MTFFVYALNGDKKTQILTTKRLQTDPSSMKEMMHQMYHSFDCSANVSFLLENATFLTSSI